MEHAQDTPLRTDGRKLLQAVRDAFSDPAVQAKYEEWKAARAKAGKQDRTQPIHKAPAITVMVGRDQYTVTRGRM
jgi:hypothetical protein